MKASLHWIKEFVDVSATPREIADRLTLAGLEVEGMVSLGAGLEKVLTATVLKAEKHPNADRLSVCEVRVKDKVVNLVCGAKNFQVGDRVALALPGVTLPNGMTLEETVIRKVKSHGMLCSEKELGLALESEGILILPKETPEGIPLSEALSLQDTIFEVNVTPNRGDCLSMQGLAREVAAAFGVPFKTKDVVMKGAGKSSVLVDDKAPELCPRYTCRVLRDVRVGPSPQSIQNRLAACGIRAINNIVDATNYVMLETGQPLHAFDLKQIHGGKVVIRRAKPKEILKTLDGGKQALLDTDLLIADGERPLALAGVMGGLDSGVEEGTTELLLESACFDPDTVRRTAKRLGLQTESSYRFERGVDPNGCLKALDRLAELILEIAGGKDSPTGQAMEEAVEVYPHPVQPQEITLRRSQLKRILGVQPEAGKFLPSLQALEIVVERETSEGWLFKIPTSRRDVTREIDVIEEVARLYGYNRIPASFPKISLAEMPPARPSAVERIRTTLADWGFTEILHYSFTSPELLKKFGEEVSESFL
jgi:phenylalanyl-tRNA synthetase beta chain